MAIKRIFLIIGTLLLFAYPATADDFLDSLDEQVSFVKMSLNMKSASIKMSNDNIKDLIRLGYSILENSVAAISFTQTCTTVAYQVGYTLDSHIIRVELVYWQDTAVFKILKHIDPDSLESKYYEGFSLLGEAGSEAIPSYYSWSQGTINFWPPPVDTGTIYIMGRARVDYIMTGKLYWDSGVAYSDTTDCGGSCDSTSISEFVADFPVNYRSIPVTYATWRAAVILKMPEYIVPYKYDLELQLNAVGLSIDIFKHNPPPVSKNIYINP